MLPVFPSAYIDDSLLTAVFVGVLLLWWLTERFGWPTTGLVVPGYLGAILAIRPDAALVVAVEAVLTYAIADGLGRRIQKVLPLDISFGRDRFFLIILASIFVRLATEVWPGPELLQSVGLDRADGWHSIGLVLVPLTANALWKPGLRAGLPLVALPVLLVFLLLRYVLLPFTNLSLVTLELTYADLEWSFLGSPRVYLLLVVGSFIASHATVRFGWDFGGIIVCGLLAIAWLDPVTVVATFAEVLLIVFIVRGLVSVPPLKTANLSGLRPIVLAFSVSYAVKFILAFVGQGVFPSFTTADLFGFGYLLPALLATRVWRHGQVARVLIPTIIVSLLGFVVGTGLGAVLSIVSPDVGEATLDATGDRPGPAWMVAIEAVTDPSIVVRSDVRDELGIALTLAASGRSYEGRFVRVDRYEDGLVLDGVGTGVPAVYWPRGGREGVEVWAPDAWQPGMAEAALAVANQVGAGLVVLGPASTVSAAHRRGATQLFVRAGEQTSFAGPVGLGARLRDLAPDAVEDSDAVLTLDSNGVAQAALEQMLGTEVAERPVYEPFTALTAYERGVALPALRARGDVRWLALAGTWAERFGARVLRDGDDVVVDGPEEGPYAVDFRVLGGDGRVVVEVREPIEDLVKLGEAWSRQLDASAFMVMADPDATDIARVWWRAASVTDPGVDGLSVARLRYDDLPGGDAVVYDGRSVSPVHEPTVMAERAVSLVEEAGFMTAYGDAAMVRARFHDGGDHRRESIEPFGGHLATVWVNERLRLAYAELQPGAPFAQALAAHGIVLDTGDVRERLRGDPIRTAAFDASWEALARYAVTGHPGALERMVSELGAGASVSVVPDPDVGRSFILIERRGFIGVAPLGYSGRPVLWDGTELPAVWRAR